MFGTDCALGLGGQGSKEMGRAAVRRVPQRDGWGQTDERGQSGTGTRRGGTNWTRKDTPPPAARRLLQAWRRRGAGIRTDSTAPASTGQPLNGTHRVGSLSRRCHQVTRKIAAARELPVGSIRCQPRILSAIRKLDHRAIPPCLIPSSGEPRELNFEFVSYANRPPQPGNRHSFRRTHTALPGATGVDTKEGRGDPPTGCSGRV